MNNERNNGLLAWQWSLYGEGHQNRRNVMLHVATVPLFMAGTVAVVAAPFVSGWLALGGVLGMVSAMAVQGRGHGMEKSAPVPFRGPLDVAARIFAEQWITFPRYILSGGLTRLPREPRASH